MDKTKKMILSKINDSEWKLSLGNSPFFILKQRGDRYYTSQLTQYEPIKEEIKTWLLEEGIPEFYSRKLGSIATSLDFNFGIIKSIIRDKKLKDLDI